MAAPTRTVDEIVARIRATRDLQYPRIAGMWMVQGGAALVLVAALLVDYFSVPLPFSLEFLAGAGAPLKVLLAIVVVLEGVLVVDRFKRHVEPAYPARVQGAATALAAAGGVMAGVGLVIRTVWDALFASYYPDAAWVPTLAVMLMLGGAAALLAGLPPLAVSVLKPALEDEDGLKPST